MNLQQLIDKGEELKNARYDSPSVDLWKNDVKAAVASFGDATIEVLETALSFGQVITSDYDGQQMHVEAIDKVQELLSELQKRDATDTAAQSEVISQKRKEAKASLGTKFGSTIFNGPVTFGDQSPANNIQVGELMLAIISEAEEKLPEGVEKQEILGKLKAIVANPTFAALAGASLPEIIKRLVG
jgi:hypothetical protein